MKDGVFPLTSLLGAAGGFPTDGKESLEKNELMNSGNCTRLRVTIMHFLEN